MNPFLSIFILVTAGLLLTVIYLFLRQRKETINKLNKESKIAETKKGKVEYALVGDGPVVLSLHGGLGGWDQGLVIANDWLDLAKNGFNVLSPSRPGYLRTPVEAGKTPEEAADAMAALLDKLNIKKVLVLGISGGGATTLQFALRHPNRIQALVILSAITKQHVQPGRTQKIYGRFLFSKYASWILDLGWWIIIGMVERFPKLMIKSMFKATTIEGFKMKEELTYAMTHPKALTGIQALMRTQFPLSTRKIGLDNDLEIFAQLPVYPLEKITCPTLVVHGKLDGNVSFSYGQFTADNIPGAEMYAVEGGGHLICVGTESDKIRAIITKFLKENSEK
jgi:pimeloyl-ACP methyl ester carboxylesterase